MTKRARQKDLATSTWQGHDDESLVARALNGESWAEEALYRKHVPRVVGVLLRLLADRAEAEDTTQEAFLLAYTRLDGLRDPSAFGPWLMRIAVREGRHRLRRRTLLRFARPFAGGDSPLDELASSDASPEERAELSLLSGALRRLGTNERAAWVLRHVEGFKLTEVAYYCDCSLATAKRRIRSAQKNIERHTGAR